MNNLKGTFKPIRKRVNIILFILSFKLYSFSQNDYFITIK